jgi:hypothetical protein
VTPAPRHLDAPPPATAFDPASVNEADVSDKPAYVRRLPYTPNRIGGGRFRVTQQRTLLAVDEAVGHILDELERTGRLDNTIVVYTSDNGVQWGEHRLEDWRKGVPYDGSIRVPLVVRYDGIAKAGLIDTHLVANLDLAPTFAALGRARFRAEGRSFVPLLGGEATTAWRHTILLESLDVKKGFDTPSFCGVRSERRLYAIYGTNEEELYDLESDPLELENRAKDPAFADERDAFRTTIRRRCFPLPPGFEPRSLCTQVGTLADETLIATSGDDYICTRGGRDLVVGGAGADTVSAGARNLDALHRATFERLTFGPTGSFVMAGTGNDRVFARNGRADRVRCGPGRDWVIADDLDRVAADCERRWFPSRRR